MSISIAQAKQLVSESLGGDIEIMTDIEVINAAGDTLVNAHEWNWLDRSGLLLDTVADQGYIDLPSYVASVDMVHTGNPNDPVQVVAADDLTHRRQTGVMQALGQAVSLSHYANADGSLVKRLEVYPTPTSSESGAFSLTYRAAWNEIQDAQPDTDVLTMPSFCEPLYRAILIATAKGFDEEDEGGVQSRLESVFRSELFRRAVMKDTNQSLIVGQIPGTGVTRVSTSHITLLDPT